MWHLLAASLALRLYVATAPKRLEGIVDLIEADPLLFERSVSIVANHNMIENVYA